MLYAIETDQAELSQRLKRLEARAIPAGEPILMKIQFACPVKEVVDMLLIQFDPRAHWRPAANPGRRIPSDNVP
jgi:hypothetical protein